MSFRGRLTLFFLLIVVVPMVTVAVLVVQVTRSSDSGKADARLAADLETAASIYRSDAAQARRAATDVTSPQNVDPTLGPALQSGNRDQLQVIASGLLGQDGILSVTIRDSSGDAIASAGAEQPVAPYQVSLTPPQGGGQLGSLELSTTTPNRYLAQVRRLTGTEGTVLAGEHSIASTLPANEITLPETGHSKDIDVDGHQLRAATVDLPGSGGFRLALVGAEESRGFLSSSPIVIAILVAFFAVALIFVAMLLRALAGQVAAMLRAARGIGEGDFTRKVPVVGHDEMAGLASEFNKMSDRLAEQMRELRRQRDQLERSVRRIGEAFASGLDRPALLQIVVETALEACRADYGRASIAGLDGPGMEAGNPPSGDLREAVRAAEEGAVEQASAVEARRANCHALASILRRTGDGTGSLGVMSVARQGEPFIAGEREVFLYLAGQASASIENVALHELVSAQAVTDGLTGLANNRRFREWIENEAERAARFGHELSLLMLDVDDFKQVNDTYGHLQGDEVLRALGQILREESRGVDEPARYGGEEFVVGLPETGTGGAQELAERIRVRIEAARVPMLDGDRELRFTASVGVATIPLSAGDGESLVGAADEALYAAKRGGKNRVEVAPRAPQPSHSTTAGASKGRAPAPPA